MVSRAREDARPDLLGDDDRPSGSGKIAGVETPVIAGLVGGGVALGVSQWLAGLATGVPSLVGAVGQTAIDWSPGSLVHLGITLLGHHDKTFVVAVILVVSALAAAELGMVAARSRWAARAGFAGFGLIGVVAASRDPQARVVEVVLTAAL